ncbi:MAG: ATP-binding cassette domain-containing protein [Chloroflexi bacterium]|nr:ATP-binding cassette domain-containing protein [Chloroflexota bacterium]
MLIVKNLAKSYRENQAVRGISFSLPRGEIFGLLGPNGAGKSTTISMLAGLLSPTSGQITIKGLDLSENLLKVKQYVGLVPQEIALYPTISARDNLIFWGQVYGLHGAALKRRVDEVLDIVQLADRAHERVEVYSGGMKRRINLAVGLLHRPEILFLDEPTVGVDPQSRNAIFESVEKLNREGLTIIYTTHYMEEAERLCHRVAIIDQGQIIALDTPANLIQHQGKSLIRLSILDGVIDAVEEKIGHLPLVGDVNRRDHTLDIQTHESQQVLMEVLQITHALSAQVTSLEIMDASLETVFLNLTGKRLRE